MISIFLSLYTLLSHSLSLSLPYIIVVAEIPIETYLPTYDH